MRPLRDPYAQRPRRIEDDKSGRAFEAIKEFAEILQPKDVDEPILAPAVAEAVYEWLLELTNGDALQAVKVSPRRLALLYGPPGCGKTTLAHHLAARLGLPLVAIQSDRLVAKFLGETTKNVSKVFDLLKPIEDRCVALWDEFDAMAAKRSEDRGGGAVSEMNHALTVMLRRFETFGGIGLAATNTADVIDPALWRRFGLQIEVALPGSDERFAIMRRYLHPYDLDDESIDALMIETRGCSPSLLRQMMEGLKRTLVLAPLINGRNPDRPMIDLADPVSVFKRVIASISPPPHMDQPPMWTDSRAVERLSAIKWPPVLTSK